MKTFSANALAEMLERDRATIVRALREVPKDATEKGQPRWKLTTALAAVDRLPGSHNAKPHCRSNDNNGERWTDPRVEKLTDDFSKAVEALSALPLKQRREVAKKDLGPRLDEVSKLLRQYGLENSPGQEELVGYRAESIWRTYMMWIKHLCEWSYEEMWDHLVTANYDEDGD